MDLMWKGWYQSYEELQKKLFMACSHKFQKQIQNTFTILDMTGFSIGMLTGTTKALVQQASKISQDNYPE